MPIPLHEYQVFIASPGGLEEERRLIRQILEQYNKTDAIHRGVKFRPFGYEDAVSGIGRPQALVNDAVKTSDFLIMVLADRWGSPTDANGGGYTSGTHEEFELALRCFENRELPMRNVVVLFKEIDPARRADPGEQLRQVLAFRDEMERNKELLYLCFDSRDSFEERLRRTFGHWLHNVIGGTRESRPNLLLDEARRLEAQGRRDQAEALFARAAQARDDPEGLLAYAEFLMSEERDDEAEPLLDAAIPTARALSRPLALADALRRKAAILLSRQALDEGERLLQASLDLSERNLYPFGISTGLNNLAVIADRRGEPERADRMYQQSFAVAQRANDGEIMALVLGNQAVIAVAQGDPARAESLHQRALQAAEAVGAEKAVAERAYAFAEFLAADEQQWERAETLYREAMVRNERLGLKLRLARNLLSLALLLEKRKKGDESERTYRRAIDLFGRLDRRELLADAYLRFGLSLQRRNERDAGERMYRWAAEICEDDRNVAGQATALGCLGELLASRGDLGEARCVFERLLPMTESLGDHQGQAITLKDLADLEERSGRYADACRRYAQLLEVARAIEHTELMERASGRLVALGCRAGQG